MSLLHATPEIKSGLDRLSAWLAAEGYPTEATGRILDHVAESGTLHGAPDLDPGDEEWAEWSFVEGLETVPATSASWDEHSYWTGQGPVYQSRGFDLLLDRLAFTTSQAAPISAGSPIPPPTADEMRAWLSARPSFADWLEQEGGPR